MVGEGHQLPTDFEVTLEEQAEMMYEFGFSLRPVIVSCARVAFPERDCARMCATERALAAFEDHGIQSPWVPAATKPMYGE